MIGSVQEFADSIASHSEEDFLRAISDIAPTSVWGEIIRKRSDSAKFVSQSTTTPDSASDTIALAVPWRARYLVAIQNHTPPSVLAKLAHDGNTRVRKAAMTNDATPLKIIAELRDDRHEEIVKSVRLIWEDRAQKRAGRYSFKGDRLQGVSPESDSDDKSGAPYRNYFGELVEVKGLTATDMMHGLNPRDSKLPLAEEGP